jgi:hypothetical protein
VWKYRRWVSTSILHSEIRRRCSARREVGQSFVASALTLWPIDCRCMLLLVFGQESLIVKLTRHRVTILARLLHVPISIRALTYRIRRVSFEVMFSAVCWR